MAAAPAAITAQIETNPLEYEAIREGQGAVDKNVGGQADKLAKVAGFQGAMTEEFAEMKKWDAQYMSYLKTAQGFAESLKAGTTIFADGVIVLRHIMEIRRAVEANPEGIAANLCMSDIYTETANCFVKVYNLLSKTVAGGGSTNMLSGAERNELLWQLADEIGELKTRLGSLAVCLAFNDLSDVWWTATAGMTNRSHGEIARHAFSKWKNVEEVRRTLNP